MSRKAFLDIAATAVEKWQRHYDPEDMKGLKECVADAMQEADVVLDNYDDIEDDFGEYDDDEDDM